MSIVLSACLHLVAWVAFLRCGWVAVAIVRQMLRLRKATVTKWGWIETLAAPEPFLMAGFAYVLYTTSGASGDASGLRAALPLLSAAVAVLGVFLAWWAFATIPSLSSGHYVLPDQKVVDRGPYAWVRHPVYLSVFLIWFALAAAYLSPTALLVGVLYVVPIYVLYMRSEEEMMIEQFGTAYREYRARVGMVVPKLKPAAQRSL